MSDHAFEPLELKTDSPRRDWLNPFEAGVVKTTAKEKWGESFPPFLADKTENILPPRFQSVGFEVREFNVVRPNDLVQPQYAVFRTKYEYRVIAYQPFGKTEA